MAHAKHYSKEVRERAVRLVQQGLPDHPSD